MRELNEIHSFIDDEFHDVNDVMAVEDQNSSLLNINNEKCADSGIIYDSDELKNCSKFSINSHESSNYQKNLLKGKNLNDSGIDSIAKFSSIREFHSKQSLSKSSIKSSSVSTVAVPHREVRATSKIRSKRYSLPDIDKLKQYNDVKCGKKSGMTTSRKVPQCDMKPETQAAIPLVPTEATALAVIARNPDSFVIDPKLINRYDGLSQSLYYIDENGSPKIRERYIKQQRMMIEKQEQKRREKEARKDMDVDGSCSCFNLSRLSKKLKELCKSRQANDRL
jgi:hypothetical protein